MKSLGEGELVYLPCTPRCEGLYTNPRSTAGFKFTNRQIFFNRKNLNKKNEEALMESVKTKLRSSIIAAIGPCKVQFETKERCMVIRVDEFPNIRIFVQPDR